jgi:uncharacterized RDD family membrane protein YckC
MTEHEENLEAEDAPEMENEHNEPALEPIVMQNRLVTRYRKRVGAYLIDLTILAIALAILTAPFREFLRDIGPYGRFITWPIMLLYLTISFSGLRNGQTIGMKILGIGVVDQNGELLSLPKAAARAFLLSILLIFNQWALPILHNPIGYAFSIVGSGYTVAFLYGLLFNRASKQTAHDWIVGTYVVDVPLTSEVSLPLMPSIHQRIMGAVMVLFFLSAVGSFAINTTGDGNGRSIPDDPQLADLFALQAQIASEGDYYSIGVKRVNRTSRTTSATLTDLDVAVWLKDRCENQVPDCQAIADDIARTVFEYYEPIHTYDGMKISIIRQYDLGLLRANYTTGNQSRIEDWEERLGLNTE